jgi:hypothetical protein
VSSDAADRGKEARLGRRDALFVDLMNAVIGDEEVSRGLKEVPGLDAEFLRKRCEQERGRMWAEVTDLAGEFDRAADVTERLAARPSSARALRLAVVSPQLHQTLALAGLLCFVLAFLLAAPGPLGARPNLLMLWIDLGLVPLTISAVLAPRACARLLRGRRLSDAVVAGLIGTAMLVFLAAIMWFAPVQTSNGTSGAEQQPGLFLFLAALFSALFVVAFVRQARQSTGVPLSVNPRFPLLLGVNAIVPLVVGLLKARGANGIATGRPEWEFVIVGGVLLVLGALLGGLGIGLQPVDVLHVRFATAKDTLAQRLRENGILPLLREEINNKQQSYEVTIQVTQAPGLSQLSDPMYKVRTTVYGRITELLDIMPGGSIGLAGVRGAGKSAVIEACCERKPGTLATMVSAPVEYSGREFLLHLYAKICREVLGPEANHGHDFDTVRHLQRRRQRQTMGIYAAVAAVGGGALLIADALQARISPAAMWGIGLLLIAALIAFQIVPRRDATRRPTGVLRDDLALAEVAAARLEEIRFQQSFTTTWSGAAKAPVGLEATFGGGRGLTRQQMHLPEIIDSLRAFLEHAARHQRVVIGIDELDKMRSEHAAEQLLNEIKGIFGVRGCFFLVSVSEDAMSNFERRGLPFRDVFDSTFDEIVWFEPLTPAEAVATIDRRVLLMPVPFKQLCYALSGGLPRDLIRTARKVIDAQVATGPNDLAQIAGKLIAQDIAGKAHALSVATRRLDFEPDVGQFLLVCTNLRRARQGAGELWDLIGRVVPSPESRAHTEPAAEPAVRLLKLIGELVCYLYYAATILEFFELSADENHWRTAVKGPDEPTYLGQLAKAREAFATSTHVAWESITRFRKAWGMSFDIYPQGLTPPVPTSE